MKKRNYTHVQGLFPAIEAKVAEGKSHREIAEEFGLKDKFVVRRLLERERKPAKTLAEYKYENKRLKMENELLRDFLHFTERE